jgi:hypothetical protein
LPGVTRTHTTISLKVIKPPAPLARAVQAAQARFTTRR